MEYTESARELLRFRATNHQHMTYIIDEDIRFARLLVPGEIARYSDPIPYPVEWVESLRSFRTFLRRWRLKCKFPSNSVPSKVQELPQNPALSRSQLYESAGTATNVIAEGAATPSSPEPGAIASTDKSKHRRQSRFRTRLGRLRFSDRNSDPLTKTAGTGLARGRLDNPKKKRAKKSSRILRLQVLLKRAEDHLTRSNTRIRGLETRIKEMTKEHKKAIAKNDDDIADLQNRYSRFLKDLLDHIMAQNVLGTGNSETAVKIFTSGR